MSRSNSVEIPASSFEMNSTQSIQGSQQLQQNIPTFNTNTTYVLPATSMSASQESSLPIPQNQNAYQGSSSTIYQNEGHISLNVQSQMIAPQSNQSIQSIPESISTGVAGDEDDEVGFELEEDSEVDTEELRHLEQEFEKKIQRAKKSYGTRMDNLHRSKEESESQHQMTLEKHEKERIEFEKRVRLAEEEQNRRLSQIQKEFFDRKHQVRQQRPKHPGISNGERPPLHGGHKRSSSHFESSLHIQSTPIPLGDLRRNSSFDVSDTQSLPDQRPRVLLPSTSLGENNGQVSPNLPVRQVSSTTHRERSESTSS